MPSLISSWAKACHHHPCLLQLLQIQHHLCLHLQQLCALLQVSESEARLQEGKQRLEQQLTKLPWQADQMHCHLLMLSPLLLHQELHSDDRFASSLLPQMDVAG